MYRNAILHFLCFIALNFTAAAQTDSSALIREYHLRDGLPNLLDKLSKKRKIKIAYLGGSITDAKQGYREQSASWLQAKYPESEITAINAGVGGTGSDLGAFRLRKQVLTYHPDLIFVEFAVNDNKTDPVKIHETMEGIVRQIWHFDPHTDICFLYTLMAEMAPILQKGDLPKSEKAMEDIAAYYKIPSIHMGAEIIPMFTKGELIFKGEKDSAPGKIVFSPDNIHPYPETGHYYYTEAIKRSFTSIANHTRVQTFRHTTGKPYTIHNWENAQMLSLNNLPREGDWQEVIQSDKDAGALVPKPFPFLIRSKKTGSAIEVKFNGVTAGIYDAIGPGTGQYEVNIDHQRDTVCSRFDKYGSFWRPHYFLIHDLKPGLHQLSFRVSARTIDKKSVLQDNNKDITEHPDDYTEKACYAGYLLLIGKLVK